MSRHTQTQMIDQLAKTIKYSFLIGFMAILTSRSPATWAGPSSEAEVTILHTNDLHSQFHERTYPFRIGGVARLKTAIENLRKSHRHTTLVDGGDWSEGSVYYTLGAGAESIRMMDHLGYDFAVVGNHDWLNGPDSLLDGLKLANPRTKFLSYNLSVPDSYPRKPEFKEAILPYKIQDYDGYKIAWIGLSTYEYVYDKYFEPIQITNPFTAAANLARELKSKQMVDGVVVLSHNNIKINQKVLETANKLAGQNYIDLIIGAHDHVKLTRPIEVRRLGSGPPAWIVETGMWGSYLGQVDVKLTRGHMELLNYQLIQMDSKIPQDPETLERVSQLDAQIEGKYGKEFDDVIGESQIDFGNTGVENLMGDFVTDCYRNETGAQLSIESTRFIYDAIHPGPIRAADVFNLVPPVYNPKTEKTWTLKTLPIKGSTLKWLLYFLFATKKVSSYGLINISGMRFRYDPLFKFISEFDPSDPGRLAADFQRGPGNGFMGIESIPVVKEIQILDSNSQFQPLKGSNLYTLATGGGLVEGIKMFNARLWSIIPLDGMQDTGKENWRVLADQIRARSPLRANNVTVGDRIRTIQENIGIYPVDVTWTPKEQVRGGWRAEIHARIRNYGETTSKIGPQVRLLLNKNRSDLSIAPNYDEDKIIHTLEKIEPGGFQDLAWEVLMPEVEGAFPVTIRITGAEKEVNTTNHEATVWLRKDS